MEFLFIVVAIVYSVWSELNKKKQEEDVDIDFSKLGSLDEFFKPDKGKAAAKKSSYKQKSRISEPKKQIGSQKTASQNSFAASKKSDKTQEKGNVDYDKLPSLTGKVDYDSMPAGAIHESIVRAQAEGKVVEQEARSEQHEEGFAFGKNDLVKSLILSEVMQRYDITRIYSRIPDVKNDD